jgi:hypothetical protein
MLNAMRVFSLFKTHTCTRFTGDDVVVVVVAVVGCRRRSNDEREEDDDDDKPSPPLAPTPTPNASFRAAVAA